MKRLLPVALFLFVFCAWSESQLPVIQKTVQPIPAKIEASNKRQEIPKAAPQPTQISPATLNLNISGNLKIATDKNQSDKDAEPSKWADPITWFTLGLVVLTGGLVYIGYAQVSTSKNIERAYVKMSHMPPGVDWFDADCGQFTIIMKLENTGNTPADITDVLLAPKTFKDREVLPDFPPYERKRDETSFFVNLVKDDHVFFSRELFSGVDISKINNGSEILYVFGYIDYIDRFGIRHRSGYARRYDPKAKIIEGATNLIFISKKNYNYDRKRKNGEGNDWNKPQSL